MLRSIVTTAVILGLSLALTGCGGPAKTTLQGIEIQLPPTKEVLRDTHDRFETKEYKVTVNSGKLVINSSSYGSVQKGDHVVVNTDSTVTVNGTARTSN